MGEGCPKGKGGHAKARVRVSDGKCVQGGGGDEVGACRGELLQTHINFPRFLPIFPDFLERLSHLAPIY
jgi:hypothetical protein